MAIVIAGFTTFAPAGARVAEASTQPKVAIIVGATGDVTSRYRSNADDVYDAARRYTSNVVKVYSPNATWAKVKSAVAGASVIVYLGHGNGWPSPYTYDPSYATKDGFGLNYDLNGNGRLSDSEVKYYGEPSIRDLNPAPNAVVLLFHLCYASGNSEPQDAEPTLSTARKRADNYAAAFLKAGARAVIANGHSHADYYIDALFTTRQSILDYWRHAPDANDNATIYPSVRNPGLSFALDPERPGSYYRSLAGQLTLTTQDVTGAAYADTSIDPATMVVPGNASPAADGAPVHGSVDALTTGLGPVATLNADARVRVDGREAQAAPDGSPIYRIHTDDGLVGWMAGSALVPRDSQAPRLWSIDDGSGSFSPNGDGSADDYTLSVDLSEDAAWTIRIFDRSGRQLATHGGEGSTATMTWTPTAGSLADGEYHWSIEATDRWGNGPLQANGTFTVDTVAPGLTLAQAPAGGATQLTPNGDGVTDGIAFTADATEPGIVSASVRNGADQEVASPTATLGATGATVRWTGKADGAWAPSGIYTMRFSAMDLAGNRSEPQDREVSAYGALGYVRSSVPVFFPQDGDNLGGTTALSFVLASPATVDWTIVDAGGTVVRTLKTGEALEAGTFGQAWNGRNDAGAMVPRGTYRSVVHATDGTLAATQAVAVTADAFRISVSDATPGRGQKITVTATSAEALDAAPRLRVYQPGISGWSVATKRIDTRVYRITIILKASSAGTLRLRVAADDTAGRAQSSTLRLALH